MILSSAIGQVGIGAGCNYAECGFRTSTSRYDSMLIDSRSAVRRCALVKPWIRLVLLVGAIMLIAPTFSFADDISISAASQPAGPPPVPHGTAGQRAQSLLGLFAFTGVAFVIGR